MTPLRGEVWLWGLGMVEKVRPALVVSATYGDRDRALITVVPHTTSLRGSEFEIAVPVAFLKPGAFVVQNVATYPVVRAIRKLEVLRKEQLTLLAQDCSDGLGIEIWQRNALPKTGEGLAADSTSRKVSFADRRSQTDLDGNVDSFYSANLSSRFRSAE